LKYEKWKLVFGKLISLETIAERL